MNYREKDYRVVIATSLRDLLDRINEYLDKGYVTTGGVMDHNGVWSQAVVYRWTEET